MRTATPGNLPELLPEVVRYQGRTPVVASGGEWTNPKTGEIEQKLHLHWRLKKPTATAEQHDMLKEARKLATELGRWRRY